jgi:Protein of unknown function (DUF524)./Domain of unknown function (DUF2357).
MESSPSSKLRFFDESGKEIPSPVEGRECGIAIDVPEQLLPEISLKLRSVSLEIFFDKKAKWVYSEWPACGPGSYDLLLECRGYQERLNIVLVPNHFSKNDFDTVISELSKSLPMSIATQMIKCGAQLGNLGQKRSVESEYLELRRALIGSKERLGLLQLLPIIHRECHHVLIPRTEVRKANQVRRPDISKLSQIMTMPGNVLTENKVFQMFDITVERSYDTHENRLVKAYVQAMRSRLSRIQVKMKKAPPAAVKELEAMISDFNLTCARATFLREVKTSTLAAGRLTMVLLKNPAYRAIFEDYLALNQQSSISLEEAALSNPLNEFPFLYELWTNLRVLNALLQICVDSGYRCVSHNWIKRHNKKVFIQAMNDQQTAIELRHPKTGKQVTLVTWRPQGGSESLPDTPNRERLMALAILIDAPKEPTIVLVFDPEYRVATKSADRTVAKKKRTSARTIRTKTIKKNAKILPEESEMEEPLGAIEPMREDIDELLRCVDLVRLPNGERRIKYAAILYPGDKMQFAPDVEALTARPSDGDGLQNSICDVLRRFLI